MESTPTDHDLGPLLVECRPTRRLLTSRAPQLLVHVLAVAAGAAFLAVAVSADSAGDRVGAGITGAVLVASSALLVRPLALAALCRVDVHEHGLVARGPGRGWTLRWDQVDQLRARPLAFRLVRRFELVGLRVRLGSGGTTRGLAIAVGEHHGGAETIAAIHQARVRVALPGALTALERGDVLPFGPLAASARGLATDRGFVAWDRISAIRSDLAGIEIVATGSERDDDAGPPEGDGAGAGGGGGTGADGGDPAGGGDTAPVSTVELDRVPDYPVLAALAQVVVARVGGADPAG